MEVEETAPRLFFLALQQELEEVEAAFGRAAATWISLQQVEVEEVVDLQPMAIM